MSKVFLVNGKITKVADTAKADYYFPSSADFFSAASNLIPGISGVSGGRVLLGDKASTQATSLVKREVPLAQSTPGPDEPSFVKEYSRAVAIFAEDSGEVTKANDDELIIKYNKLGEKHYNLFQHYLSGRKSYIHHTSKVKKGDTVRKGQVLATSNYSDEHGDLALGVNLKTVVMPYRSLNFEDAFVVTEAGAAKLVAEQLIPVRLDLYGAIDVNKNKYISLFPNRFILDQLSHIDDKGVVKKGTVLKHGDPVILAVEPRALKSLDIHLGNLGRILKNAFSDRAETWEYLHEGTVVDVAHTDKIVTVTVKTQRGLETGDKISVPFGAKGITGSIIPDTQAPTTKDGKPVDLILNSMSVVSRIAPSLLNTMAIGKVAQKLGHPLTVPHFTEGSAIEQTIKLMKKHDVKDMEELYDPVSGKNVTAFVGPLHVERLHHIAEDKLSHRSRGIGYDASMQPTKGSSENSAKRVGNLATNVLLAHDAKAVLRDIGTVRATKNDEFWRALEFGQPIPAPKVPFIFDQFVSMLQGAGLRVSRNKDKFHIFPQTDKDIKELSHGPIGAALTYKLKGDELIPEKNGLFDVGNIGIYGDRYNHLKLDFAVPNPISEEYLRKLLKVTEKQFHELISSGELGKKLAEVDVNKRIKEEEVKLRAGKKSDRDNAVKVVGFLKNLKKEGVHPSDLMLNTVPVIPARYRPITVQNGVVMSSGVNELYKDLIIVNNQIRDKFETLPEDRKKDIRLKQYEAVKAIYGLGDPINAKNEQKNFKGLLATVLGIRGGQAKEAFFQAKVVNKPVDLVGRAVLTSDVKLDLDEASIPQDTAWKIYTPFIIRRLVQRGLPATYAKQYVDKKNPIALEALHEEMRERPGMISRDPMLHKYNMQGFYFKTNPNPKDQTFKLNPIVFKGFNADLDGDQLNVQLPATEEARDEIIEKLLPSKNLLSPRSFTPMFTPSNESALGLFLSSSEDNHNKVTKFKNEEEVLAAFNQGKIDIGDRVVIG